MPSPCGSTGSQRAPHKPLLLLLALATVLRGEPRLRPYGEIEEQLRRLLVEFGPYRRSVHPEYPFWRLQNDGDFWEIPQRSVLLAELQRRPRTGDVPPALLFRYEATGGFTPPVYDLLRRDPQLVREIVGRLLHAHFPPSLHDVLLDAVGMPAETLGVVREPRDPLFRVTVLRIYEHRCAVCGFDGKLGLSGLALDAAHVMWHAAGGPDREDNGLALCALHHRLLDHGALGLTPDHRILVSQHVHGSEAVGQWVVGFAGQSLPRAPARHAARGSPVHPLALPGGLSTAGTGRDRPDPQIVVGAAIARASDAASTLTRMFSRGTPARC